MFDKINKTGLETIVKQVARITFLPTTELRVRYAKTIGENVWEKVVKLMDSEPGMTMENCTVFSKKLRGVAIQT